MANTRLMNRLFSATRERDAELTEQVANDIEDAKAVGSVDTEELRYDDNGDGSVSITDKGNGEVTVAERDEETGEYDLYPAEMTSQIEGFLHPGDDGVTPGRQRGARDERVSDHMNGSGWISPELDGYGLNPEAGHERSVIDLEEDDQKEFSVYSDNFVVQRIFDDQAFCERVFSEVIDSEETAKVGDLKIEKSGDEDNTVIVTSEATGDQVKVTLEDDEMEVTELDSRNFSTQQYESLHVVGVDPINHVLVDAPEYDEESAQELVDRLTEQGVEGCRIFDNPEEARDYAFDLLANLGVEDEDDVEEPEEATFSDVYGNIYGVYATRYYSNSTEFMDRMFSESANDIDISQSEIEDVIEKGEELETESEVVTPVDDSTAVVEDKDSGEFTKVTIDGPAMELDPLSKREAREMLKDVEVVDEDDEEEKEFSDVVSDEYETKFFSEYEHMNSYMVRLFSEESDKEDIEDAIEKGEQVETDSEVITPVDDETAVIEDKETGEFSKAVLDDGEIEVTDISESEADKLTEDLAVEDDEEEKKFSDVVSDEYETKFFSEYEYMTDYMIRLFSDESDKEDIEDAIEDGEEVETDDEIITPVDDETAVIEDKETGEFSKAVLDDGEIEVTAITKSEAEDLLEDVEVSEEKKFSDVVSDEYETKFFSEYEYMNSYMCRLFSEEADKGDIEDAIEEGEEIETDSEIITPVDEDTAIIEDKETGEFSKAVLDDGEIEVTDISEREAKEELKDVEKKFSRNVILDKFFAEALAPQQAPQGQAALPGPAQQAAGQEVPQEGEEQLTIEAIEDKALAAVQSIQAAAAEAEATILNAKSAPVGGQEEDLQEAQFSDFEYLDTWYGRNNW